MFSFANRKVIVNLYTKDEISFYFVFINFLYWYKCNVLTCVKYFVSHRFIKLFPFTINLKYLTQYSILMHPEIFLLLSINWFCILMTDNLCFSVHFLYIHFYFKYNWITFLPWKSKLPRTENILPKRINLKFFFWVEDTNIFFSWANFATPVNCYKKWQIKV